MRHYFASWSFSTITYKALVISDRLTAFYPDLEAADFEAPFTIFHSRFSTNTAPAWERAQPFRYLCHNGEINTIQGNERRMDARGVLGTEAAGLGPEELFRPLLDPDDSDSGKLDAALELLLRGDATCVTSWRCSCPRRGRVPATSTRTCATSTGTTRRSRSRGTARPA